jgi:DNA sulfur modification protein DndE
MALTLSLDEGHEPNPNPDNVDATGLEFNLTTLFGDAALVYESLLRQAHGNLSPKEAQQMLAGHIDNGIGKIKHAKNVADLL